MITAFALALFAAAGALARAEAGRRFNRHDGLPLGTLLVNVTGSLLVGLLHDVSPPLLTVLAVAGLGAFTTMSSFARDTVALAEQGQWRLSFLYVAASAGLSVVAAWVGLQI